ncbi:hypothetical protein Fmac_001979 [Flemingia macrophylla]|uniref:Uncharacterized protein n=1 Tax=Flemingia macrophylla TaxID=520843 RepID=A0ABD1NIM3_9FABA
MKKTQLPLNPSMSPARLRRAYTETNLKGLKPNQALITSKTKKDGARVSDVDSGLKVTRGRLSSFESSPLSSHVRREKTSGHVSDSESSSAKKRASLSPFAVSSMSPYESGTCGHVSD